MIVLLILGVLSAVVCAEQTKDKEEDNPKLSHTDIAIMTGLAAALAFGCSFFQLVQRDKIYADFKNYFGFQRLIVVYIFAASVMAYFYGGSG